MFFGLTFLKNSICNSDGPITEIEFLCTLNQLKNMVFFKMHLFFNFWPNSWLIWWFLLENSLQKHIAKLWQNKMKKKISCLNWHLTKPKKPISQFLGKWFVTNLQQASSRVVSAWKGVSDLFSFDMELGDNLLANVTAMWHEKLASFHCSRSIEKSQPLRISTFWNLPKFSIFVHN